MGLPTAHKFRHVRGTSIMEKFLKNAERMMSVSPTAAEVEKVFWDGAREVAIALHHSVIKDGGEIPNERTSVKSYINPELTLSWFSKYDIDLPRSIQKILRVKG